AGPHAPAGLGADDQLVAMGPEIEAQNLAEVLFRTPRRRAVVVGQVEVGDAQVEGAQHHRTAVLEDIDAAEVVPQAQGDGGQANAAAATAAVLHGVVALFVGL